MDITIIILPLLYNHNNLSDENSLQILVSFPTENAKKSCHSEILQLQVNKNIFSYETKLN